MKTPAVAFCNPRSITRLPVTLIATLIVALTFTLAGTHASAQVSPDQGKPSRSAEAMIKGKLAQAMPQLSIESVQESVAPGLYEVRLADGGPTLYTTPNGDFFVLGDLFAVKLDGLVNLAEQERNIERAKLIAEVPETEMIIFEPEGETLATVSVFTDVDCFYCQKLHQEVPALNKKGISVRYLAWPRAGVGSPAYRKIASAWCADNPQDAITRLKSKQEIEDNVCPGNPVADQFLLGQKAGVRGTPAIVFESGEMLPGYVAADELAARAGL